MAELKTKRNTKSVNAFLNGIEPEQKRKDAKAILALLKKITTEKPEMWGSSIIGFGKYSYTGSNGKTNEWMAIGFSPRKQNVTVYVMPGYEFPEMKTLLKKLGKYKTGKSCLYINKLEDIDMKVLEQICRKGYTKIVGKHINYSDKSNK